MIRYEPRQIEALFKGCSLSGVYLRTVMEFKSTSISAVHLSLSCASLPVCVDSRSMKTSSIHEVK